MTLYINLSFQNIFITYMDSGLESLKGGSQPRSKWEVNRWILLNRVWVCGLDSPGLLQVPVEGTYEHGNSTPNSLKDG